MTVATTGAEWNVFYNDPTVWEGRAWHEEEELTIDGVPADDRTALDRLPIHAKVILRGGVFFNGSASDRVGLSLESKFKQWKKSRTHRFLAVEVPLDKFEAVKSAVIAAGGKIK